MKEAPGQIYLYKNIIIGYSLFLAGLMMVLLPSYLHLTPAWDERFTILGTALLPTGLIGLINEYFLKRDLVRGVQAELETFLQENSERVSTALSRRAVICDANPTEGIAHAFSEAHESILLLNNWMPDFDGLKRGIQDALSRRVKIKILLMDPQCKFAVTRATEIGMARPAEIAAFLQVELDNICSFLQQGGAETAELRVFDSMPAMPAYATESEVFIGWYFKGKRAIACPVIHVRGRRSPLREELQRSFDLVWSQPGTRRIYPETST